MKIFKIIFVKHARVLSDKMLTSNQHLIFIQPIFYLRHFSNDMANVFLHHTEEKVLCRHYSKIDVK